MPDQPMDGRVAGNYYHLPLTQELNENCGSTWDKVYQIKYDAINLVLSKTYLRI